uniref:ATP synthase complex subunit 8 n=1 Tax=Isopachys gyldenstolpei TaxID=448961 RepID=A0A411AEK6_9SAUR|nr:ATP synthase F0 subunit 8 [Isopachys gyldenstolpei]QAX27900.1 ATP synthase F0 subunit 8 [Isopachys gyldenstolpei]
MPQLNPAPWFFILLLSWAVVLMMFKTKVLLITPPTSPAAPTQTPQHTTPWNWPWI